MILTEEEAAKKRCPLAFGQPLDDPQSPATSTCTTMLLHAAGACYVAHATSPVHCLGSRCMAWRWHSYMNPGTGLRESAYLDHGGQGYKGYCSAVQNYERQ